MFPRSSKLQLLTSIGFGIYLIVNFEWDERKAELNLGKHRVSFEEAVGVFFDHHGVDLFDEKHSSSKEDRFIRLGYSKFGRILLVIYTERKNTTRIITARKAEPFERKIYEKNISS